jgi:hypothetical protein
MYLTACAETLGRVPVPEVKYLGHAYVVTEVGTSRYCVLSAPRYVP